MSDYLPCISEYHTGQNGSSHPKNKVPISLFINSRTGHIYKACLDCRNVNMMKCSKYTAAKLNNHKKLKEKQAEDIKNNKNLIMCPGEIHHKSSKYPRDSVPLENFKKYPDRDNSSLLVNCLDCRLYDRDQEKIGRQKLFEHCKKNNIIVCTRCEQVIEESNKVINTNGEPGKTCQPCKDKNLKNIENAKNTYNELKYDLIHSDESCCNLCHSIFIVEDENLTVVVEIPTFMIDDIRHCQYKNIIYKSLDFIKLFKDKIILGILELDHMTENEQREAGILTEQDVYIPKVKGVSQFRSKENILNEAKKCQLICGKCHVIETIRREKGTLDSKRTASERIKLTYCNELKKEGCTHCHYVNEDLPRFFHFDHIDPLNKITGVSTMAMKSIYSYDDMLNEIKKTRILCKYCHYIVTQNQHKQGIIKTNTHVYCNSGSTQIN